MFDSAGAIHFAVVGSVARVAAVPVPTAVMVRLRDPAQRRCRPHEPRVHAAHPRVVL